MWDTDAQPNQKKKETKRKQVDSEKKKCLVIVLVEFKILTAGCCPKNQGDRQNQEEIDSLLVSWGRRAS